MTDYGLALDMMLTAMERRGTSLADVRDPADAVLERTAFQHAVTAGFQQRECVRCGHGFQSVSTDDRVCGWCRRRKARL